MSAKWIFLPLLVVAVAGSWLAISSRDKPRGEHAPANGEPVFYWTTPPVESDTCVAAWLLTRFVSPGARVELHEHSLEGVPFDVPGSALQRQSGLAASDVVVRQYSIDDAFARKIVEVIHEIELNPWTTRDDSFFVAVRSGLADAINLSTDDRECLAAAMDFLDDLRASNE